jgi:hypothetical protein
MALAELKAPLELGEKVSVTDLAKKAGVSRKTIYSAPYCHFLDVLAKSVDTKELTSDSATQFELQISQLSHQLNEKDRLLQEATQSEKDCHNKILSKCLSEIFLSKDLVHQNAAALSSELEGTRKQLNNRIEQTKDLRARISILESELAEQKLSSTRQMESVEWTQVPLSNANSKYLGGGSKAWLKEYVASSKDCVQELAMRARSSNIDITVVSHTFCPVDRIDLTRTFSSSNQVVLELALVAPALRKLILKPFFTMDQSLRFIALISNETSAKWHVRTSRLGVPEEVISMICKDVVPPSGQDGYKELTIRYV